MVVGARTIKSYGWENHYIQKIRNARLNQRALLFWQGMIGFLGLSVFQNGGLIVIIAILVPKWARGEKLDEGVSMSLMAMVFYIFMSANAMTYYGMTSLQQFSAIVLRMSEVFELDEYSFKRNVDAGKDKALVKFENADISWGF